MAYGISLSGLQSASEAIDVTSNNIANAQTVGYKTGEYVFADQFFRAQDPQNKDRAGMGAYRQALRDITTQTGFPWTITWPDAPQ